ncbi:hypothetical protein LEMLEM_LOCUS11081 [Lemmus lemmus]
MDYLRQNSQMVPLGEMMATDSQGIRKETETAFALKKESRLEGGLIKLEDQKETTMVGFHCRNLAMELMIDRLLLRIRIQHWRVSSTSLGPLSKRQPSAELRETQLLEDFLL